MSSRQSKTTTRDWWRDFFEPLLGEVMFASKVAPSNAEVDQIIRRAKAKPPMDVLDLACGIGRREPSGSRPLYEPFESAPRSPCRMAESRSMATAARRPTRCSFAEDLRIATRSGLSSRTMTRRSRISMRRREASTL